MLLQHCFREWVKQLIKAGRVRRYKPNPDNILLITHSYGRGFKIQGKVYW